MGKQLATLGELHQRAPYGGIESLLTDPDKPLINRATQGQYPTGSIMRPFIQARFGDISISNSDLKKVYKTFGFFQTPQIQLPVTSAAKEDDNIIRVSPLQMVLACAALSNHGMVPAPRIAMAVNTPGEGWVALSALGMPFEAIQSSAGDEAGLAYLVDDSTFWSHLAFTREDTSSFTWFIGGTPPNWQAAPLTIVVILEEDNERLAERIGRELLIDAMSP